MKLVHLGMISTGVVIALGLAMVVPAFTQQKVINSVPAVMLTFSIGNTNSADLSQWCDELATVLDHQKVVATVFVSGKVAEKAPECVNSFHEKVDIGSQTFSYVSLTSITDYGVALEEVKKGKEAVDRVGGLNSKLFKAPFGIVDENIYSYLSKSGIAADFSYINHYNKYEGSQFIRYDLKVLPGNQDGLELYGAIFRDDDVIRPISPVPIALQFDSAIAVEDIEATITELKSLYDGNIQFVNASDIADVTLTQRGASA